MLRYVIRRLLLAGLTLLAISAATFGLFFAAPSDPAEAMCGKNCTPEMIANTRSQLGIDRPIVTQYAEFMTGIVAGRTLGKGEFAVECEAPCFGYSFRTAEPVTDIIERTVPVTVSVVVGSAVIWLTVGIALGVFSALHRGTVLDKLAIGVSLAGASMQVYFFGLILLMVFVYTLRWLPNPGYVSPFSDPAGWVAGMALPWLTLGFLNSAIYARLSRAQMLETMSEDFIRTARAKGLPRRTVHLRHGLRAAITPLVTVAGLDIGATLGGVVITESTFSLNGLGREAVAAVETLNLPVIMATVLLSAGFIVIANLVVDLLYAVVDPRVRLG